jgi:5-methylcytosine-specific restriction protein A
MEKRVETLVYRRMTYADFRHINKSGGEELGGGGQSYIDFPINDIQLNKWFAFLGNHIGTGAQGRPQWNIKINSLGISAPTNLKIYQRRAASVSIASQKIHSRLANRVPSWHPDNGFPSDYNPANENLVIYIVKTIDGEYWAGWFLENQIPATWIGNTTLSKMFTQESAGYTKFNRKIFIETTNKIWPFYFDAKTVINDIPTENDVETELELEDTSPKLQELIDSNTHPEIVNRVMRIRQRNNKLVRNLKNLYKGKCQISGEEFTFVKKNGELYSEVHHLIPLGENGSDSYANAIVVSPLIHRMLHYAEVSEINLNDIIDGKLPVTINGVEYEISWHSDHMSTVDNTLND